MARRYKRDSRGRFASGNRGGSGGYRPGAGRPKGSLNKAKLTPTKTKPTMRTRLKSKATAVKKKMRGAQLGKKLGKAARNPDNWSTAMLLGMSAASFAVSAYAGKAGGSYSNMNATYARARREAMSNTRGVGAGSAMLKNVSAGRNGVYKIRTMR